MELWIRSQSKLGIIQIDEIYIDERDFGNNDIQYYIMSNLTRLGIYKTKERALEVLDEIQNLLEPKVIVTDDKQQMINSNGVIYSIDITKNINTDIQELSTYVYEMPEE